MTDDELLSRFKFTELTEEVLAECEHFSCGISDLDEYFQKDVIGYTRRMDALAYYEKNGFTYLFPSEEEESKSTRKDKAVVPQATRLMYFDLMDLQPRKNPI